MRRSFAAIAAALLLAPSVWAQPPSPAEDPQSFEAGQGRPSQDTQPPAQPGETGTRQQPPGPSQSQTIPTQRTEAPAIAAPSFSTLPDPEIQGIRTKSEPISNYLSTQWYDNGSPVGMLEVFLQENGNLTNVVRVPCTAWLVGPDLVMTAYHCMPGISRRMRERGEWTRVRALVSFRYDGVNPSDVYPVASIVESNESLDYALLRLAVPPGRPAPGNLYGVMRLLAENPRPATPLYLIHHPYGYFQMVLKDGTCRAVAPPQGQDHLLYHHCDTRGGSSGAPVIVYQTYTPSPVEIPTDTPGVRVTMRSARPSRPEQLVVGLHTTGLSEGLTSVSDFNAATRITAIVEASPTLRRMACGMSAGDAECPDLAALRPTLIFFDWDSDELNAQSRSELESLAASLASRNYDGIIIAGHTDTSGSAQYAVSLSQRMASMVRQFLTGMGVPEGKMTTRGLGQTQPMVITAAGVREPLNRRVEVFVCPQQCDAAEGSEPEPEM